MFILNVENEVDGTEDAGVALWRAFNYIEERHGTSEAFTSMIHVSSFPKAFLNNLPVPLYLLLYSFKYMKMFLEVSADQFDSATVKLSHCPNFMSQQLSLYQSISIYLG